MSCGAFAGRKSRPPRWGFPCLLNYGIIIRTTIVGTCYKGFVPDFARDNMCGKTISIVCFEIAPEYRGQGIASAFIEQVCVDAKAKGYVAVEGYAKVIEHRDEYDFTGPIHLYEKAGFSQIIEQNGVAVMRKLL